MPTLLLSIFRSSIDDRACRSSSEAVFHHDSRVRTSVIESGIAAKPISHVVGLFIKSTPQFASISEAPKNPFVMSQNGNSF